MNLNTGHYLQSLALLTLIFCGLVQYFTGELAVLWLPNNPRRAALVFLAGIGAGFTLGWVQQMRGQHFLTHTLWTAWLSSAVIVALIAAFSRQLKATSAAGTQEMGQIAGATSFLRALRRC